MKGNNEVYEVMNTIDLINNHPTIYDVCYCLYYKGKAPQRLLRNLNKLQSTDVRKFNYCPDNILSKVKSFIS